METGISVIICCYNSSARIGETLRHLSKQNTPGMKWEIILVDNASTDETRGVALKKWKELGREGITLHIVDEPYPGLAHARARGIAKAMFSILIFCDDDNWFESNYVFDAFRIMNAEKQLGALGGTGLAVSDKPLPDWFEKYKKSYACFAQGDHEGVMSGVYASLYGAGLVVRGEALKKLNDRKFMPLLTDRVGAKLTSGGDTELSYAIRLAGYQLGFSYTLRFQHFLSSSRLTEEYLLKLNESLAYCSSRLIIYRYVLSGKAVDRFVWLKDATYQTFLLFKSWIRFLNFSRNGMDRKLDLAFSFYSLKGVFGQLGTYRSRYRQISRLRE